MRLGYVQEVDRTSMVVLALSLVFIKTRLVIDASRHSYVKTESTKLDSIDELSDIFTTAKSIEQAFIIKLFVIDMLGRARWVDKGQMPTRAATYLGLVGDSFRMEFYLPEMKILKIKEKILELLSGSSWVI